MILGLQEDTTLGPIQLIHVGNFDLSNLSQMKRRSDDLSDPQRLNQRSNGLSNHQSQRSKNLVNLQTLSQLSSNLSELKQRYNKPMSDDVNSPPPQHRVTTGSAHDLKLMNQDSRDKIEALQMLVQSNIKETLKPTPALGSNRVGADASLDNDDRIKLLNMLSASSTGLVDNIGLAGGGGWGGSGGGGSVGGGGGGGVGGAQVNSLNQEISIQPLLAGYNNKVYPKTASNPRNNYLSISSGPSQLNSNINTRFTDLLSPPSQPQSAVSGLLHQSSDERKKLMINPQPGLKSTDQQQSVFLNFQPEARPLEHVRRHSVPLNPLKPVKPGSNSLGQKPVLSQLQLTQFSTFEPSPPAFTRSPPVYQTFDPVSDTHGPNTPSYISTNNVQSQIPRPATTDMLTNSVIDDLRQLVNQDGGSNKDNLYSSQGNANLNPNQRRRMSAGEVTDIENSAPSFLDLLSNKDEPTRIQPYPNLPNSMNQQLIFNQNQGPNPGLPNPNPAPTAGQRNNNALFSSGGAIQLPRQGHSRQAKPSTIHHQHMHTFGLADGGKTQHGAATAPTNINNAGHRPSHKGIAQNINIHFVLPP